MGVLPSLSKCRASLSLGRELGVDAPSTKLVGGKVWKEMPITAFKYGETVFNLYRHPRLLIPRGIDLWEKDYEYSGDGKAVVPFMERHPCWLEALEIYEGAISHFKK